MDFRIINASTRKQAEDLWDYCFEKREEPFFQYYFNNYCYKDNLVLGCFEGQQLLSMLHLNPYMLAIRGIKQIVPYIVGVATAPEARGRHLTAPLLSKAFELARVKGHSFVTLMPIYAGIYLPYQFAFCYNKLKYVWNIGELALPPVSGAVANLELVHVKIASELEEEIYNTKLVPVLAELYAAFTEGLNGAPQRTAFQWNKLLAVSALEGLQAVIAYEGEEPVGYMLYKIAQERFYLQEVICTRAEAKYRLLAYVEAHISQAKEAEWLAELWDKTYLRLKDASQAPQLQPFMMARCINALKALLQLANSSSPMPKELNTEIVVLFTDNLIEENNLLLKISCQEGRLSIEPTTEQEDVVLNMATFTQLYFGAYTATELYEAGIIECGEVSRLLFLDLIFSKQDNWINEYF